MLVNHNSLLCIFLFVLLSCLLKKNLYCLAYLGKNNQHVKHKLLTAVGFEPTPFRTRA